MSCGWSATPALTWLRMCYRLKEIASWSSQSSLRNFPRVTLLLAPQTLIASQVEFGLRVPLAEASRLSANLNQSVAILSQAVFSASFGALLACCRHSSAFLRH